ncbi:MAG: hypothetical protein KDN19_01415 [Verrucomicrobiae bacterium]|nr:hypothetical protein [Verrucomicrobiae bacterium]
MSRSSRILFRLATFVVVVATAFVVEGQEVTVQLTNGTVLTVRVESVDSASLAIRTAASQATARLGYDQIASVEWPETQEWVHAEQLFRTGQFGEAAVEFERLSQKKTTRDTFYPAPGNFATRAHLRMLDCFRYQAQAPSVAKFLPGLEIEKLPAAERELSAALELWALAGKGRWEKVLTGADAGISENRETKQGEMIELTLLKGMALEELGRFPEATLAYAASYSLNAATDRQFSKLALRRSIEMLASQAELAEAARDERREEKPDWFQLRAQAQFYASVFGKGELWENAHPVANLALSEKLTLGETALGQNARNRVEGEMGEASSGSELIEQVTADQMKQVEVKKAEAPGTENKDSGK